MLFRSPAISTEHDSRSVKLNSTRRVLKRSARERLVLEEIDTQPNKEKLDPVESDINPCDSKGRAAGVICRMVQNRTTAY